MKRDDELGLRVPPHSLEAEQSVLGGLLLDNSAWDRAADLVTDRDFYQQAHRLIFGAIGALVNANKAADVITVGDQLQRMRRSDECGGLVYLNELAASVPSAANMRRYAEIVRERADQRALISALSNATEIAWGEVPMVEKLDAVGNLIASLELRTCGKEALPIDRLVIERLDHYQELANGEKVAGIPTGLEALDRALGGGLKPGKLVVLGARPSVGKTSLAGQIASNVASAGHPVTICSQEMTAGELVDRFVANESGVQMGALSSGQLTGHDWASLTEASVKLNGRKIFIDDTPALSLAQIRAKARQVRRQHGLTLIVIDYLQLCAPSSTGDRRHHQIESISRGLKALAKELGVCVLLLSQLNRASTDRLGGEPELTDLKESGAIEEDADAVLLLHPWGNEPDGRMLVLAKLSKNRSGRRGRIALAFDGKTQRWAESSADVSRRTGAKQ